MIIFALFFLVFAAFGAFLAYSSISGIKKLFTQSGLETGTIKGYQFYLTTMAQGNTTEGFNPDNLTLGNKLYQEYVKLYVIVELPESKLARLQEGLLYIKQPSNMDFFTFKSNIYSLAATEASRLYPIGSAISVSVLPSVYTNREVFDKEVLTSDETFPKNIIPQGSFQWKQAYDLSKKPPKMVQFVLTVALSLLGIAIFVGNLWFFFGFITHY